MQKNIWRIKIKSYDCGLLDNVVKTLINMAKTLMVGVKSVFLPVQNKKFALLKSSFIYTKSKEHFGLKTHTRALYLDLGSKTLSIFNALSVPSGVTLDIKRVKPKVVR